MEYHKGIAVPVKFSAPPGGDTSILVRKMTDKENSHNTVFRKDIDGKWKPVEGILESDIADTKDVIYRDTIYPAYQTMNSRPPWKDNWSNVTKVDFESGTAYIKPESFYNRSLLIAPIVFFFGILSFFLWQLAFFINNIQRGEIFIPANYKRLRNMGIAVLAHQALLFILYLLESSYQILVNYQSTIPNYRPPVYLVAEADYHIGAPYLLAGALILVVANAFKKGYTLQQEQDLTI